LSDSCRTLLGMTGRASKDVWAERILAWKHSGLSAHDFARGQPFQVSTLRWWASRLRSTSAPRFVRVVSSPAPPQPDAPVPAAASCPHLIVSVGDAQIQIRHGFDPVLLAAVVGALGGAR
jgi:hypothetical protein